VNLFYKKIEYCKQNLDELTKKKKLI